MAEESDRELRAGWMTSLKACSVIEPPSPWVSLWRRRKWWIIGAGIVILEAILMSTLGSTIGTHF
jgi:hypothetical protein